MVELLFDFAYAAAGTDLCDVSVGWVVEVCPAMRTTPMSS